MIRVLQGNDIQAHAGLMDAIFRLRYEHFVVRRKWPLPCRDGRDIDQYDAEDAGYIVVLDDPGEKILGCARMNHTLHSSLLADLFPHLNETDEPSRGPYIYEGTRFTLSPDLQSRDEIRRVRAQICHAAAKWAYDQGGTQLQAVVDFSAFAGFVEMTMQTRPLGLAHEYGGGSRVPGGGRCIAFRWNLIPELFEELEAYGRDVAEAPYGDLDTIH